MAGRQQPRSDAFWRVFWICLDLSVGGMLSYSGVCKVVAYKLARNPGAVGRCTAVVGLCGTASTFRFADCLRMWPWVCIPERMATFIARVCRSFSVKFIRRTFTSICVHVLLVLFVGYVVVEDETRRVVLAGRDVCWFLAPGFMEVQQGRIYFDI